MAFATLKQLARQFGRADNTRLLRRDVDGLSAPYLAGPADWQIHADQRLRVALLLSTLLVAAILSVFRMPNAQSPMPLVELVVRLIEQASVEPETRVPAPAVQEIPFEPESVQELPQSPPSTAPSDAGQTSGIEPVPLEAAERGNELSPLFVPPDVDDWQEFGTEVVQEFVRSLEKTYSVNPILDEKRRIAAIRYRPSNAPRKKNPWDNVEKDQIGRTILDLGGGCFQVLDDPSAVYRDIFETYTQFVAQCTFAFGKVKGRELPWVQEIRDMYPYLQRRESDKRNPDAFIPANQ